jgi:DNA-binding transcriptional ArsR family regulator
VDDFVASVQNGANLAPNSPALQLRNWCVRHSGRTRTQVDGVMATLTAVSAELRGAPVGVLHTSSNGYETLCARRRALHILDTPLVSTGRFSAEAKAAAAVQPRILKLLRASGEMEYADICDEIGARRATVSDALYKLKQKDLVHSTSPRHWAAVPSDVEE